MGIESSLQPPPTVTIVTPSFNQAHFIRATIESVLAQDYPYIEYIVMDGGSSDHTASIVAEYTGRLTWISEKDRGQSHAINKGFAMAKGEIVAWLNSDDVLLPGAVSLAVDAFRHACPGIGGVYGEGYLMDREGRVTCPFPATEPFNLWKLTYLADYVLQQSTFFRRSAVAEIGWIDESLHYAMDWDLLIRLGKRFGLHYIPAFLGVLREYAEAKTSAGGRARIEEIRQVLERHTGLKRAPGYWVYDLERIRGEWKDWGKHSPAWLRGIANRSISLLSFAMGIPIMLIHRRSQGLHHDRWATDRLKWMLPQGRGDVVVRGHVPFDPAFAEQTLTVWAAGRELCRRRVGPGAFEFRFASIPDSGQPFEFEVHAAFYKRPNLRFERSFRRIAWVVEEIEWANTLRTR